MQLSSITNKVSEMVTAITSRISSIFARIRAAVSQFFAGFRKNGATKSLTSDRVKELELPAVKRVPLTPGEKLRLGLAVAAVPVALIAASYFFGSEAPAPLTEAAQSTALSVLSSVAAPVCAVGKQLASMALALRPAMHVAPVASSMATCAALGSSPVQASLPAFEKLMETTRFFSELAARNRTSL